MITLHSFDIKFRNQQLLLWDISAKIFSRFNNIFQFVEKFLCRPDVVST